MAIAAVSTVGVTMAQSPIVYEWECPVCGITRVGLTFRARTPVEDQARNAIDGHVRQTVGNGHGGAGELPPGFDAVEIAEHVRLKERFGRRATERTG